MWGWWLPFRRKKERINNIIFNISPTLHGTLGVLYFYLLSLAILPLHPPRPLSGTPVSLRLPGSGEDPGSRAGRRAASRAETPCAGSVAVAAGTDSGCGERRGGVCVEWGRGTGPWPSPRDKGKFFCGFLSCPLPRLTTAGALSHWGEGMEQTEFFHSAPSPVTRLT